MEVIWKDIPGYTDYYQVSNTGLVKRKQGYHCRQERILKFNIHNIGYLMVHLSIPGHKYKCTVHSLVMKTFIGPYPLDMEINHKDGIKSNNNLDNLEYITRSKNMKHAYDNKLNIPPSCFGESSGMAKLTNEQVLKIREIGDTISSREVAKMFGVVKSTILHIRKRNTCKHI